MTPIYFTRQGIGMLAETVALSLRDRTAGCASNVDWHLQVDCAKDAGEAFGLPVAERQGYLGAEPFQKAGAHSRARRRTGSEIVAFVVRA